MSNKKLKKQAREHAKQHGISYQAARRAKAPETSSFVEQIADLGRTHSRVHAFHCCGHTQVFSCPIEPGFADHEDVRCTHCHAVLANVRCDWGSPKLVREVKGDANEGVSAYTFSDGGRLLVDRRKE